MCLALYWAIYIGSLQSCWFHLIDSEMEVQKVKQELHNWQVAEPDLTQVMLQALWLPCPSSFSSVQFSRSVMSDSLWPHEPQHTSPPCPSPTLSPPKPMSIESVMPSNHLILCRSLLLLPSIFPSIRVFSNESALPIRWPKPWSFSFNISPSNEHSGLISFRMDWLDLLAVQGTLKSLFQHYSSKASILRHSAFFIVQLTSIHDHWKNHRLD